MAKQIKSIKHIGIYTTNFDKMVDFYKNTLGLIELFNYEDSGKHLDIILKCENARVRICKLITLYGQETGVGDMLELIGICSDCEEGQEREIYTPGLSHIAFGVTDIFLTYKSIISGGGQGVCEPMLVDESGNYIAFCRDIEGNYLELIQKG